MKALRTSVLLICVVFPSCSWCQDDLGYSFGLTIASALTQQQREGFSSVAFIEGLNDAQDQKTLKYTAADVIALANKYAAETNGAARGQIMSDNKTLLSYCLGAGVGKAMVSQGKQKLDSVRVTQGITDGVARAKPQITDAELNKAITDYGRAVAVAAPAK